MSKIDQLVDAMVGHQQMSFLDTFQGYHQIALAPEDQEKTTFITPKGNYHYTMMPFGLKNVGATYQQMVTRMFKELIGTTVEAYIDDMVVKTREKVGHAYNLEKVFNILRQHKLRLYAKKCAFEVGLGKFLGCMITTRGIEVNPDQITAIQHLHPPNNPKEFQKLTGMIFVLNRFVSRSLNRCRPFYQLLKKWKEFHWMEECDLAFKDLKSYLASPLILFRPDLEEVLYMYLAMFYHTVSSVLFRQHGGIQRFVYYLSKTLVDAKTRYLPLDKMALALVYVTRKLPHYFQTHTVWVLTEFPLQSLLRRSDFTRKIVKWGTRLGMLDVCYKPRNSIKRQVLTVFVAKFTPSFPSSVGMC